MSKALILVAPGLLELRPEALAAMPSLSTFGRHAGTPRSEARGIVAALLAVLGMPASNPTAPLALLGAGADPGADYVLHADPVHLVVDRDTVRLAATIDDLTPDDAQALARLLDRHFAADDLRFDAVRPDAWFARRPRPAEIVTTPPDVARGTPLLANLPRGPDSGRWRRWQNETQMLLHEHPVNIAREARQQPPVNAVWFWGGGRLVDVGPVPPAIVATAEGRLGDLGRGIALCRRPVGDRVVFAELSAAMAQAESADAGRESTVVLAILPPLAAPLPTLDATWLAPALALLASGRIGELHLVADGNGTAATWTARRAGPWERLIRRASPRALITPAPPDA